MRRGASSLGGTKYSCKVRTLVSNVNWEVCKGAFNRCGAHGEMIKFTSRAAARGSFNGWPIKALTEIKLVSFTTGMKIEDNSDREKLPADPESKKAKKEL